MAQAHARHRLGHPQGLGGVGGPAGEAGLDRAETTGARADVAQDHEGCGAPVPALPHVRAVRLLADGMEVELAHEAAQALVAGPLGRPRLDPGRPGQRGDDDAHGRRSPPTRPRPRRHRRPRPRPRRRRRSSSSSSSSSVLLVVLFFLLFVIVVVVVLVVVLVLVLVVFVFVLVLFVVVQSSSSSSSRRRLRGRRPRRPGPLRPLRGAAGCRLGSRPLLQDPRKPGAPRFYQGGQNRIMLSPRMIITCPSCAARYKFDEAKLGDRPKAKTKCAKCGATIEIENPLLAAMTLPPAFVPAAAPPAEARPRKRRRAHPGDPRLVGRSDRPDPRRTRKTGRATPPSPARASISPGASRCPRTGASPWR